MHQQVSWLELNSCLAVDGSQVQAGGASSSTNSDGLANSWDQRQADARNGCNAPT